MSEHGMADEPWFTPPPLSSARKAVVIGAGVAGCSISYALSQRGLSVRLLDSAGTVADAASGNRRAIIRPHVTRAESLLNRFNEDAFTHTLLTLNSLSAQGKAPEYAQPGVLQLLEQQGEWPDLTQGVALDAAKASALAEIDLTCPALHFPEAGWLNARSFCQAMLDSSEHIMLDHSTKVTGLNPYSGGWQVHCESEGKNHSIESELVVVATGASTAQFDLLRFLDMTVSVGQTTLCRYAANAARSLKILAGKRFLIPQGNHCIIGSTHWNARNTETPLQMAHSNADNENNLSACGALYQHLPTQLTPIDQWRALRISTSDRLPTVGGVPDSAFYTSAYADVRHGRRHTRWPEARYLRGLYVLSGLGSRGLSTASLSAELLAEIITGQRGATAMHPLRYQQLLHPARFLIRRLKRQAVRPH